MANKHFILTREQADVACATSKPGHVLLPVPCGQGLFFLPFEVADHPDFVGLREMLLSCETTTLTAAQFAAQASQDAYEAAREDGWDPHLPSLNAATNPWPGK